jgi:hypothetical protein
LSVSSLVCPQPALYAALAARALDLAQPSIERLLAEPDASGERLRHVIVLDPRLPSVQRSAIPAPDFDSGAQPWLDEAACNIVLALCVRRSERRLRVADRAGACLADARRLD